MFNWAPANVSATSAHNNDAKITINTYINFYEILSPGIGISTDKHTYMYMCVCSNASHRFGMQFT